MDRTTWRRLAGALAMLCGLAVVVAPAVGPSVAVPSAGTTTLQAHGHGDRPDPVGWCWLTRACTQ